MSENIKIDESMVDSLDKLVRFKYNTAFTDEHAIRALSEAFVIMNNIIEDSAMAEQNVREMYKMLENLTKLIEGITQVFEDKSEIRSLVSNMNDLSRTVVEQNENMRNVIGILSQIADQLKTITEKTESTGFVKGFVENSVEAKPAAVKKQEIKFNWGAILGFGSFIALAAWFLYKYLKAAF